MCRGRRKVSVDGAATSADCGAAARCNHHGAASVRADRSDIQGFYVVFDEFTTKNTKHRYDYLACLAR